MKQEEISSICGECGASVYRQHIDSGIARYEGDRLLCAHCVSEYERSHDSTSAKALRQDEALHPITLDEDDDERAGEPAKRRIQVASGGLLGASGAWQDARFHRPLDPASAGASRCRTFHCKLNEGSIEFMTNQINDWLDGNENIVVKFSTSTIGIFEGKHSEPNLILTLWY